MISISDILDGTTSITREILDMEGFTDVGLVAHVAKYSSTMLRRNSNGHDEKIEVDKMTYLNDPSNTSDVLMKLTGNKSIIQNWAHLMLLRSNLQCFIWT